MPTRKILDHKQMCRHPEHLPPTHQVFDPGTYEHRCPNCNEITIFTIPQRWCYDGLVRKPLDCKGVYIHGVSNSSIGTGVY